MARPNSTVPASPQRIKNVESAQEVGKVNRKGDHKWIDGQSKGTYLVIAEAPDLSRTLSARCVGGIIRLHAHPSFRAWGIVPLTHAKHRPNEGYYTTWISDKEFTMLYEQVQKLRGVKPLPMETIVSLLNIGAVSNGDDDDTSAVSPASFEVMGGSDLDEINDEFAPEGDDPEDEENEDEEEDQGDAPDDASDTPTSTDDSDSKGGDFNPTPFTGMDGEW